MPATGLTVIETHKYIRTLATPPLSNRSRFEPPRNAKPVLDVLDLHLRGPNLAALASPERRFSELIPARLPQAGPDLIDLSQYYNAAMAQTWHPGSIYTNNTLDVLPCGLLQMGNVAFDVRGIVQMAGGRLKDAGGRYPVEINGITIAQRCRLLHFLHASGWRSPDGTLIGSYVVHYANGSKQVIPIVYGEDVRDWVSESDDSTKVKRGVLAWSGLNRAGFHVRLFRTTWVNPTPEIEINTIDCISSLADAAPFLLAITAQR